MMSLKATTNSKLFNCIYHCICRLAFYFSSITFLQVALCFSPVGNTLRVRARKFPGVVNCTAIDWFHEWPKDALESVSLKFLGEIENIEVSIGFEE